MIGADTEKKEGLCGGVGRYLHCGTVRIYWLMPLLLLSFLYNVLICSKALLDLCVYKVVRNRRLTWRKTLHSGKGNNYTLM